MEGMRLAVEAMTSITKLQLHAVETALSASPFSAMLQGQAMMGQMLMAAFTGHLVGLQKRDPRKP
jgi:hypothetical protein